MLWHITDISCKSPLPPLQWVVCEIRPSRERQLQWQGYPNGMYPKVIIWYVQVCIGKLILGARDMTQRFKKTCYSLVRTRLWIPAPMSGELTNAWNSSSRALLPSCGLHGTCIYLWAHTLHTHIHTIFKEYRFFIIWHRRGKYIPKKCASQRFNQHRQ